MTIETYTLTATTKLRLPSVQEDSSNCESNRNINRYEFSSSLK